MQLITSKDSIFSSIEQQDIPKNILNEISSDLLKNIVEDISFSRHYVGEPDNNLKAANYISDFLREHGWYVEERGEYRNIIASLPSRYFPADGKAIIGATHYDSVSGCPGADDNGSGIAVLLAAAKALPKRRLTKMPVLIFFNREEDGLLGSFEYVKEKESWLYSNVECAHVMEMVGYTSSIQAAPPGLPVDIGSVGDFLGMISNEKSHFALEDMIFRSARYCPDLITKGIVFPKWTEMFFSDIIRSDHYPFWKSNIPALMWTDTSEFRNPNYHLSSDTPDTLNYDFMLEITKLFTTLFF